MTHTTDQKPLFSSLREYVFITLQNTPQEDTKKCTVQNFINRFLYILIIANVIAMIIQTIHSFQPYKEYFRIFENISLVIFSIEYLLRLWTYPFHKKYKNLVSFILSPVMVFDALVILPHIINLFIPNILDLRILRILRIFRIFRLYKYSNTINKIIDITVRHKHVLLSAFSFIMMGVFTSATLIYFAEKDAQPELFSSIPQAIYWAVITISTVGYGDFTPVTDIGKCITICTTILGVAIYALPTSILGAAFYAELMSKESYKINALQKENDHLQYLLKDSKREMKILRDMIKKDRENNRETQKNIKRKFLHFFFKK